MGDFIFQPKIIGRFLIGKVRSEGQTSEVFKLTPALVLHCIDFQKRNHPRIFHY